MRYGPVARGVPVLAILAVQAVLTGSLIHLGIASGQESQFIYAGHQIIRELWHGGGSPYYETYLPGVPSIYPVIAAVADFTGGLAAVRLMSLVFMLAASWVLYLTARRLFGYWPAVAATGVFGLLGVSRVAGASATPDALAIALMGLAAYCAVRAAGPTGPAHRWLLAVPAAILAANAVSYPTVLFDPAVICLGALLVSYQGRRRAWQRAIALTCSTATLLGIATALAGTGYLMGIGRTLLLPGVRATSETAVALASWRWVGLVIVVAALSLLIALLLGEHHNISRLLLLTLAGLIAMGNALLLHNSQGVSGYDALGGWFAAAAAGYSIGRLAELARSRVGAALLGSLVVVPVAAIALATASQATALCDASNSAIATVTALQPYLTGPQSRHYLIDSYEDIAYDLHPSLSWQQVTDSFYINYEQPGHRGRYLHGTVGVAAAIENHWFALISVPSDPGSQDSFALLAIRLADQTPGYQLASTSGGRAIYVYGPDYARTTG